MDMNDEIECLTCDGEGNIWNNADPTSGQRHDCEDCKGTGWRLPTQDEYDSLAEAAYDRSLEGEPSMSMQERHERDWKQKQELRR